MEDIRRATDARREGPKEPGRGLPSCAAAKRVAAEEEAAEELGDSVVDVNMDGRSGEKWPRRGPYRYTALCRHPFGLAVYPSCCALRIHSVGRSEPSHPLSYREDLRESARWAALTCQTQHAGRRFDWVRAGDGEG